MPVVENKIWTDAAAGPPRRPDMAGWVWTLPGGTLRIDGSAAAEDWLVSTGIAFDNPDNFVFENGAPSFSPVSLRGVERIIVNGLAGADRLAVEEVFGTRFIAVLGGTVEVDGQI